MKNIFYTSLLLSSLFVHTAATASPTYSEVLPENTSLVKAGNKYVTLLGTQVTLGKKAPDFTVVDQSFKKVNLASFKGKAVLISSVLSIDTPICSLQTKRFNDEAANLSKDLVMMTISTDLPFAQKRFCQAEEISQMRVFSDSVYREFGDSFGLRIKDMGLLARAIFIIDADGIVHYQEIVENVSSHPNYEKAIAALKVLLPKKEQAANLDTELETSLTEKNSK